MLSKVHKLNVSTKTIQIAKQTFFVPAQVRIEIFHIYDVALH